MNKANNYRFSASWTEEERMRMVARIAARIHAAPIEGTHSKTSNFAATIIYLINAQSEWLENNRRQIFIDAGIPDHGYPEAPRVSLESAARSAIAAFSQFEQMPAMAGFNATYPADIALAISNLKKALEDRKEVL